MKYAIGVFAILLIFALTAPAADVTGKWQAEVTMGGNTRTSTFDFKVDGDKLTGTVTGGRGSSEITEGKVSGDDISFVVVRKFQEREIRQVYKGKVSGNEIKFNVTAGERSYEMTAKKI